MARSLWKGAITFGLVNIPVELFPAEERKGFQFSMLDKRDFSPVGYKRYSKKSGKEVEWANIVKGYEYEKDQYVVLSDEDFRRANVKASQTIDIKAFVPPTEIPAQYFETPYYLAPADRGEEGLRAAARDAARDRARRGRAGRHPHDAASGRGRAGRPGADAEHAALRRRAARHQRTSSCRPKGIKSAGVSTKEVDLAKRLVDDMTEHWKPAEFKDTYHQDLMRRIHEKIKAGRDQGDHQAGPRTTARRRARRRSSISPPC